MLLAFDIGNTAIKCILLREDDEFISEFKIPVKSIENFDDFDREINENFIKHDIKFTDFDEVLVSCVVARIDEIIVDFTDKYNKKLFNIKNEKFLKDFPTIVPDNYKHCIGSDILANIVYGKSVFAENFVVIDMGSATTFDIVGKEGKHIGEVFIAGMELFNNVLSEKIPALPLTRIKKCKNVIGTATEQCIENGVFFGYIGAIKEIVANIKKELQNDNVKFILTGGCAEIVRNNLDFIAIFEENTVIKGLKIVYDLYGK